MVSKEKQQWKSPQTNQYTIRLVSFPRILEEMSLAKPIGGNDKVICANYEDEFPSPDLIASLLLPFSSNPLPAAYPQFKSYSLLRKKRKVGSLSLFFMIPWCKDSFINLNNETMLSIYYFTDILLQLPPFWSRVVWWASFPWGILSCHLIGMQYFTLGVLLGIPRGGVALVRQILKLFQTRKMLSFTPVFRPGF